MTSSITYAELYAIAKAIEWLQSTQEYKNRDIHFFVDSLSAKQVLCEKWKAKKYNQLIQDILHTAEKIEGKRELVISLHWIPSHIDKLTQGRYRIEGNTKADNLANIAQEIATDEKSREQTRDEILMKSIDLIWNISSLLLHTDGPSSDDFSSANANQIAPRGNL